MVLQDLGFRLNQKTVLYLQTKVLKFKNWEGFPQTSQSHKTLANSLSQNSAENKNGKIAVCEALLNKSNRIWN